MNKRPQGLNGRAIVYAEALRSLSYSKHVRGRIVRWDRAARYVALLVRLSNSLQIDKALGLADPLALATGTPVVIAQREGAFISYQFQLAHGYWKSYTRANLQLKHDAIGMGFSDGGRQVDFQFTHAAPHSGFFGTTGSGKTVALDSLLAGLFSTYTPDQLNAAIVDPDGDHLNFYNVAHLAGLPIARDNEGADQVLSYVNAELVRRKRAGQRDGRRLVVAIDEAEEILTGDRLAIAQTIARDGRKWGINLVLASPDPTEQTLPDLLPKILNRWVGLVADGRVSAYLTGQKAMGCHMLTGEGDFMHTIGGREQERLLIAMPTEADYSALPRAELAPPTWDNEDVSGGGGDVGGDGTRGPGRPPAEIEPEKLAYYLVHGPDRVSQSVARDTLGLGRPTHYKHRDFAMRVITEIKRLMEVKRNGHK